MANQQITAPSLLLILTLLLSGCGDDTSSEDLGLPDVEGSTAAEDLSLYDFIIPDGSLGVDGLEGVDLSRGDRPRMDSSGEDTLGFDLQGEGDALLPGDRGDELALEDRHGEVGDQEDLEGEEGDLPDGEGSDGPEREDLVLDGETFPDESIPDLLPPEDLPGDGRIEDLPGEDCGNNEDDDQDGLVDCQDPDCRTSPLCSGEECEDGEDNDGDGLVDCEDPDCLLHDACLGEECGNGEDDDGDGAADCEDLECLFLVECGEERCEGGEDDDGDGLVDCEDPDCGPLCGMEVPVRDGSFIMGREGGALDEVPAHEVSLSEYLLDGTEVTLEAYVAFLNDRGSHLGSCLLQDCAVMKDEDGSSHMVLDEGTYLVEPGWEGYPVTMVTWAGARAYCLWADKDLPTEAQWEKGARGLDGRLYPWGDHAPTGREANCLDEECLDPYPGLAPVGSLPDGASPYGALDMGGNVIEWVRDRYDGTYYDRSPLQDPTGPEEGEIRARRGGSFRYPLWSLATTDRDGADPLTGTDHMGFRCVREQ